MKTFKIARFAGKDYAYRIQGNKYRTSIEFFNGTDTIRGTSLLYQLPYGYDINEELQACLSIAKEHIIQ